MPKTLALVPMKTRIAAIARTYGAAQRRVYSALTAVTPENYTEASAGMARRRVEAVVAVLNAAVHRWARPAIVAAYNESKGISRTRLEMLGAKPKRSKKYGPQRHEKKIAALTKTVIADFAKANRTILKTARKYLGVVGYAAKKMERLQQVQAFSSQEAKGFIDKLVRTAVKATSKYNLGAAHLTTRDISRQIAARLARRIGGGDFIEINGRNYSLGSYSELVARTRMRESQTEATRELCAEYSNDLVEIPAHDNPCELCAPHQGKVYSISGGTPGYEPLPAGGPPWH